MKNFVQKGETLSLTAPYQIASGAGLLIGSIFGVAVTAAESGAAVEAQTVGVFDLAKTSAEAWTVGAPIFWDDSAKEATIAGDDNTLIGVAVGIAANPSSTGRVRLNGAFGL
jgi:predicted RecA/RadA family phage recombinase